MRQSIGRGAGASSDGEVEIPHNVVVGAVQPGDTGTRAGEYCVDNSQPVSSAAAARRFSLNHLNGNATPAARYSQSAVLF